MKIKFREIDYNLIDSNGSCDGCAIRSTPYLCPLINKESKKELKTDCKKNKIYVKSN